MNNIIKTVYGVVSALVCVYSFIACSNRISKTALAKSEEMNIECDSFPDDSDDSIADFGSIIKCDEALKAIKSDSKLNNANKEFAFKLIDAVYSEKENFSISPVSLSISLSMLAEGASGETFKELESFLTSGLVDGQEFIKCMGTLSQLLNYKSDNHILREANSLWINKDFKVLSSYSDILHNQFQAGIYSANLCDKSSVRLINEWGSRNTGGMINNFLTDPPMCDLACLNTIYLSEKWYYGFEESNTENRKFTNADGNVVYVPTMKNLINLYVAETPAFYKITIPARSRISVDILFPKEGIKLSKMNELKEVKNVYNAKVKIYDVDVTLPKFKIYYEKDLKDNLKKIGLYNIFDAKLANFSRMCSIKKKGICVGRIKQDNVVSIDENGISASAMTIWDIIVTDPGPDYTRPEYPKLNLKIDRPFYYCIHSQYADVIYFFGKVNQLTE